MLCTIPNETILKDFANEYAPYLATKIRQFISINNIKVKDNMFNCPLEQLDSLIYMLDDSILDFGIVDIIQMFDAEAEPFELDIDIIKNLTFHVYDKSS